MSLIDFCKQKEFLVETGVLKLNGSCMFRPVHYHDQDVLVLFWHFWVINTNINIL